MDKIGHPDYSYQNDSINEDLDPILEEIFHTDHHEPLHYLPGRSYNKRQLDNIESHLAHEPKRQLIRTAPHRPAGDRTGLDLDAAGAYEKTLIASLAWGQNRTHVLMGEMGSGKTTTIGYVQSVLKARRDPPCADDCNNCEPIVVILRLDGGTRHTAPMRPIDDVIAEDLSNRLEAIVLRHFTKDELADDFLALCPADDDCSHALFAPFMTQLSLDSIHEPPWSSLTQAQKTAKLLTYVRSLADTRSRLDAIAAMAGFVKQRVRRHSSCFVIIADNIDRYEPAEQQRILMLLFGLKEANIPVLLTMRPTTFEGLRSNATYSFACLQHSGPSPMTVVRERIRYFLDRWDSLPLIQHLPELARNCLRDRLQYVFNLSRNHAAHLRAVCGDSIRLGLTVAGRLSSNKTVPVTTDPAHPQDVLRCVLLHNRGDQLLDSRDRYLANLFVDPTDGSFSWAPMRWLQVVNALRGMPLGRNTRAISSIIMEMTGLDQDSMLRSLNYLLLKTRPLLWVDSVYEYSSYDALYGYNDEVNLTSAGRGYLKVLANEPVYLQEALIAADWTRLSGPVTADYRSKTGRSEVLRAAAKLMIDEDLAQLIKLRSTLRRNNNLLSMSLDPMSISIACRLSRAVESVRGRGGTSDDDTRDEASAWHALFREVEIKLVNNAFAPPKVLFNAMTNLSRLARQTRDRSVQ